MSKNEDDTEFNFSDAEDAVIVPPPRISPSIISRGDAGMGRSGGLSSLWSDGNKRKLVLLAIGLIVVVLAMFKLLEWFLTPSSTPEPVRQSAQVNKTTTVVPVEQKNAPMKLMVEEPKPVQNADIQKLQERITQQEMTLEDLQTQFAMMSQLVQAMSQQLQQQTVSKTHKAVEPAKKQRTVVSHHARTVAAPVYYIQAMVPGRAWLENQKGDVTTVSVGDEIPGYGVITVIDFEQGTLSTNKGKIINYRPDDR